MIETMTSRLDAAQGEKMANGDTDFAIDPAALASGNAFLAVSGVAGDSTSTGFKGDFELTGFGLGSFELGNIQTGIATTVDPLAVTLAAGSPGAETLIADAGSGKVLGTVTLYETGGNSADGMTRTVYKVVLTGATVVQSSQAGDQVSLAFDYQTIQVTPYTVNPDGTTVAGTPVTYTPHRFAAPAPVAATPLGTSGDLYLSVRGVAGPSTAPGFAGDFTVAGYQFSVGATGTPSPLVVSLGDSNNDRTVGASKLFQDSVQGTVIASITLTLAHPGNGNAQDITYQTITLTDATVSAYSDAGGQVTLAFGYQGATVTTYTRKPDGTPGSASQVTLGASSTGTTASTIDPAPLGSGNAFLAVSGVAGDSTSTGFKGDFELTGFGLGSFELGNIQTGIATTVDPLAVTLAAGSPGAETLIADAGSGKVLGTVTLYETGGNSADGMTRTVYKVVLTGATVVQSSQAGDQVSLAFDYQTIQVTPYTVNPDGTTVAGTPVTYTPHRFAAPAPVAATPLGTSGDLYLSVRGVAGPSTAMGFAGDFTVAGYQFSVGATGTPSPLVVALGNDNNDRTVGASKLFQDSVQGTVIASITLTLAHPGNGNAQDITYQTITLTDATVSAYSDAGGQVTLAFGYQGATVTTYTRKPDGTPGPASQVTLGASSTGTTASTIDPAPLGSGNVFLAVSGVAGDSTAPAFKGDFELTGFSLGSFELGNIQTGIATTVDPLAVTLAAGSPGAETLIADAGSGKVLGTVTLYETGGNSADGMTRTVYKVVLTGATVVQSSQAGDQVSLAFDYQTIQVTPYTVNPDGTTVAGTPVTYTPHRFAAPAPVAATPLGTSGDLYLSVRGVAGPSTAPGFAGDFTVAGYQFSVGATGTPSPLVVSLGDSNNDRTVGASKLFQDSVQGTVIASITLTLAHPGNGNAQDITYQTITLTDATVSAYSDAGGQVTLAFGYQGATVTTYTRKPDGTPGPASQVTLGASDGSSAPCYTPGTLIATGRGDVPVEDLAIGDLVVVRSGGTRPIKWIGRRSYARWLIAGNDKVWPVLFKAGSLADGLPRRDLMVSPEHAMFLDGALIPADALVNGASIRKVTDLEEIHYLHLEFEGHELVLAEGAWAESFADDSSRGLFHNAAEYHVLYLAEPDRDAAATFCAPRIEDGFELAALKARLAGRALRLRPDGSVEPTAIRGCLDTAGGGRISGWAMDALQPDRRVPLVVLCDGVVLAQLDANIHRPDLEQAGIGDGAHGFELLLPDGLAPDREHVVELRSADTWAHMSGSPRIVCSVEQGSAEQAQSASARPGELRGSFDSAHLSGRLSGWAMDTNHPDRPVGLVVSVNDVVVTRVVANRLREDLRNARIGSGRHAFEAFLPTGLACDRDQVIRIQREADGLDIEGSPKIVRAGGWSGAELDKLLGEILQQHSSRGAEDEALVLLKRHMDRLLKLQAERRDGQEVCEAAKALRRHTGPAETHASTQRMPVIDEVVPVATREADWAA